jgi:hypothetical protein
MPDFKVVGEQRRGVLLALSALTRITSGGRGWNERLYRNGIIDCEQTLMHLLGAATHEEQDIVRDELKELSRTERGAAKAAAKGDV